MTTIGYATLQIIPSLKGVSEAIDKQLGGLTNQGQTAGKKLGSNIAAGVRGSEAQISAALSQAVNARGGEKVGQQWADSTASAMAKHLQSAQNTQKLQSSLTFLLKNGDAAGKKLASDIANSLAIDLPVKTRAQQVGEKVGTVIGKGIGAGIKVGIAGAAAAVAGIGYTLTKGFQRLESIDQATFKLKALGHSGAETKTIMDNATASVKGTAFSLAEAATTAASAVAAGIQPGKDLTQYLTNVADASAVAGTSLKDMGDIFNGIQTQNKAYTGDLDQLATRGIPIFQWLAKEYGVTGDALSKMVQNGEVDAAHFNKAISDNIGGAAKNMGQSFQGSVDNMETAIARLGAHFLGSIFGDKDGSQLAGPTEAIGKLTEKFDKIDAWVQAHGPQIHQFFTDMVNDIKPIVEKLGEVAGFLADHPRLVEAAAAAYVVFKGAQVVGSIGVAIGKVLELGGVIGAGSGIGATGLIGGVYGLAAALGVELGFTIFDKMEQKARDAQAAIDETNRKLHEQFPGQPVTPAGVPAQTGSTPPNNPLNPNNIYGRASGGSIFGPGTATSDSVPIMASRGEHMWTASEVNAVGGQGNMYRLRALARKGVFRGLAGGGALDFWKLGGTGGDSDVKGHGVGDIGQRIDSPLKPRNPIWGDERRGIIQGPGWSPRGNQDDVGVFAPWWMFPGDKPSKQRGGIFGMDPRSPGWDRRRDIFGQVPGRYDPPVKTPFQIPGPSPGAQWWGPSPERLLGFAGGGAIGPDVSAAEKLVGHPYSQGSRFDCSGDVARVINAALGMGGGLMSTKTAKEWLAARGFVPGTGGPGQISVGWYDHGPNPNDGHMAMTLSDGRPAEGGGSVGVFTVGAGASGASNPQFDQHMFLPTIYGEGPAGPSSASPFAGGSAAAAVTGGGTPPPSVSSAPTGGGGGGSSFSLPSSISGLASFGLDDLGKGVGTTGSGSDLSLFGKAAGAAVSGQVDSALGVLGVSGSPGWLKAISTLVGGIKIGGGGGSANPLAAGPSGTGTPAPDDPGNMHGSSAGQAPGPQTVYNIRTATVEDAFLAAQRKQNERNAAKLSRF